MNPSRRSSRFSERSVAFSAALAMLLALPALVRAADESTKAARGAAADSSLRVDPATVEIRRQLESQYQRMAHAYVEKDRKTIFNVLSPDYHRVYSDGKIEDIKIWRERIKLCLRSHWDVVRWAVQSLRVSESGLIAVAEVNVTWSLMPELAGERQSGRYRRRDTWVKTTDGWRLKMADDFRDLEWWVGGKRVDLVESSSNGASVPSDSTSTPGP